MNFVVFNVFEETLSRTALCVYKSNYNCSSSFNDKVKDCVGGYFIASWVGFGLESLKLPSIDWCIA